MRWGSGRSHEPRRGRAAERRWLDALEDDGTTEAINRAIEAVPPDHAFTDAAAAALIADGHA